MIFSDNKEQLKATHLKISACIEFRLGLKYHPDKVFIKILVSGADFLGWVHFFQTIEFCALLPKIEHFGIFVRKRVSGKL